MRLAFSIPGKPKGKERPRVAPGQSRPYTPKQTVEAEKAIRTLFLQQFPDHQPWTGPVMIRFTAVFEVPKSWPAELRAAALAGEVHAICKPDKDNIEKLIVDAISEDPKTGRRIAWIDDAQLQGGGVKRYGTHERVDVVLDFLELPAHLATPGQRRRDAMTPEQRNAPRKRPSKFKTKSGNGHALSPLEQRIAAALERDSKRSGPRG
jgi:Holliday junction resolvase RusA-like endonuclease